MPSTVGLPSDLPSASSTMRRLITLDFDPLRPLLCSAMLALGAQASAGPLLLPVAGLPSAEQHLQLEVDTSVMRWRMGRMDSNAPFRAADVAMVDLIVRDRVLHTHPDDLTEEALPIVHDCPQVAATIRAEEMTEVELTTACAVLKETEDRYHAKMQTDPRSPIKDWYDKVEILMFSSNESLAEWYFASFGREVGNPSVYYWPFEDLIYPWTHFVFFFPIQTRTRRCLARPCGELVLAYSQT